MDFLEIDHKLIQSIGLCLAEKGLNLSPEELPALVRAAPRGGRDDNQAWADSVAS